MPMPGPLPKPKRQKPNAVEGTALVIVLSCLVLLAALAISLLNRVESDRSSSAAYRGGTLTRTLAEYAINVVMAQITAATKSDPSLAWASQPGAIRTYSASGSGLQNIYKLYSSTNMVANAFPSGDITDSANWAASPALYTDLNAPAFTSSGNGTTTNYPILDPGATNSVQGFAITGAPTTATQPAPMPVNWLYVLQDGTLVAPTGGSGNTVTVNGASSANPITGRIAFWADDDTCKVNVNTASGAEWYFTTNNTAPAPVGTGGNSPTSLFANYWDIPMFGTLQDNNLTFSQPWRGEYQRFPGHPATVSLSAVFTNLSTNDIMAISPRVSYQSNGISVGSQWGSSLTTNYSSNNIIPSDGARLYANVDELLYATNRSSTNGPDNPLTTTQIERGRFFATASSRAPDVTLFNTPRLLCWPINTSTNKRTPYDNLIAFCGTLPTGSANTYFFQRQDATSSTTDYNANTRLLGYLRQMATTAVPGFGGSGILGKYSGESDQITTEIFDYIRCINLRDTSMNASSYYYSANGLVVPTIDSAKNTFGYGRFPTVSKVGLIFWYDKDGVNPPTFTHVTGNATNTYTNSTCQIISRLVMETFNPALGYPAMTNISGGYSNVVTGLTNGFQWGPDANSMAKIFSSDTATYTEDSTAPVSWSLIAGRRPIIMSTNAATTAFATNSPVFTQKSYNFSGGNLTSVPGGGTIFSGNVTTSSGNWTYVTNNATINIIPTAAKYVGGNPTPSTNTFGTFFFTGGTNVEIKSYYNGTVIQDIKDISLPGANMQLALPTFAVLVSGGTTNTNFNGAGSWNGTLRAANANLFNQGASIAPGAILTNDVVLSAQIASGDYRMARRGSTPTSAIGVFTTHPGYWAATNSATNGIPYYYAHSFTHLWGIYKGASMISQGYYAPTNTVWLTNTNINGQSEWPNGDMITNGLTMTGDFDNGYGSSSDGPYIGFCDEGTTSTNAVASNVGNIPYFPQHAGTIQTNLGPGFFSPNRLVPSPGVMGSLPTGVMTGNPWQTLLFRPAALTTNTHPGLSNPPDYLLLDLFNMPVVEPYAISEPLSTAGRVNMNYQILPFTWIKRSTAVQAALHTERITAFPIAPIDDKRKTYKNLTTTNRFSLDLGTNTGTLRGFEDRFATNDIFRSAAEICSIPLVPYGAGATYTNMASWWTNYAYTGENSKERPYARIYPKLTTKSNTYTVHYRVEVLKKSPGSVATTWTEGADKVISTYRGSTTIERYVNPGDPAIIDYASQSLPLGAASALPYKFRVLADRQFNP
jgi:uncharacterized protein (TIGR02600 family)